MSMFNKSIKIGEGQKYDISQVSADGLTQDEIEKMDKKARKLIDIYNTDGQKGLTKIELAYAMDGFASADKDNDGKLSDKELEAYANEINNDEGLLGDNALSGKDLKAFLKEVKKFTKCDTKVSTSKTIDDDTIAQFVESRGLTAVDGQEDLYEKDGKYTKIVRGDKLEAQRVVKDGENFRPMTQAELVDEKAAEGGYEDVNFDGTVYIKDGDPQRGYIYDDNKKDFVRAKYISENNTYVAMTDDEIREEEEQIAEHEKREQQRIDAQTPKEYTVQLGDKLDDLLKLSLERQGLAVTEESLAAAKEEFIKNNPNTVRTNSRGVDYLYAGDVVKIAGNLEDKANAEDVKQAYRAQQAQRTAAARQRAEAEQKADAPTQKAEAEQKAEAPTQKVEDSEQKAASTQNKNSNVIKFNGADPVSGKYKDKNFVVVSGNGLCKYNPKKKGYELYSGTYNGKYYENGKIINIASKTLVKYDEETSKTGKKYPDDYYRNYKTYHYNSGSLTPLYRDPTYDSNVQIKIGDTTYELAYGSRDISRHWDFHDFVSRYVDEQTGAIRAKEYISNIYYLKTDKAKYEVTIDMKTKALMVEINGKKYDMNDLMTGKVQI